MCNIGECHDVLHVDVEDHVANINRGFRCGDDNDLVSRRVEVGYRAGLMAPGGLMSERVGRDDDNPVLWLHACVVSGEVLVLP